MYTSIELFAGAGGLALGVEKAGFNTLGLIEFDKDAADTLKKNRPNWNVINDDIANISCLDLEKYFSIKKGELDLLSGGAPCQAFSYAGKRLGLEDARGTLFYHYALFLEKLQPKMFLFENVRGLLTHDHGKTYSTMLDIFTRAGYTIDKQVLNAWNYGVPQKRERLITIGIRNDLVGKTEYRFPKAHSYKPVLRDVLLDCPDGPGVPYGEKKRKIFEAYEDDIITREEFLTRKDELNQRAKVLQESKEPLLVTLADDVSEEISYDFIKSVLDNFSKLLNSKEFDIDSPELEKMYQETKPETEAGIKKQLEKHLKKRQCSCHTIITTD